MIGKLKLADDAASAAYSAKNDNRAANSPTCTDIARDNFSDAAQFQFWKFLSPSVQHLHRAASRNGEQQFKILAVGERRERRRCDRRSPTTNARSASKIGRLRAVSDVV